MSKFHLASSRHLCHRLRYRFTAFATAFVTAFVTTFVTTFDTAFNATFDAALDTPLCRHADRYTGADGKGFGQQGYAAGCGYCPPGMGCRRERTRRGPFNSTPVAVNSIPFGSRTYAPWGCIVRVVSQTKSRKIPTRKISLLAWMIRPDVDDAVRGAVQVVGPPYAGV